MGPGQVPVPSVEQSVDARLWEKQQRETWAVEENGRGTVEGEAPMEAHVA